MTHQAYKQTTDTVLFSASVSHITIQAFTCWNDANVKVTWLQHDSGVVFWNSRLLLGSSNHTVQELAEHAISTHTNHTAEKTWSGSCAFLQEPVWFLQNTWRKNKGQMLFDTISEIETIVEAHSW